MVCMALNTYFCLFLKIPRHSANSATISATQKSLTVMDQTPSTDNCMLQCVRKKRPKMLLVIYLTKLGRFWWNLIDGFVNKFAIKCCKLFPSHLNSVCTLPLVKLEMLIAHSGAHWSALITNLAQSFSTWQPIHSFMIKGSKVKVTAYVTGNTDWRRNVWDFLTYLKRWEVGVLRARAVI